MIQTAIFLKKKSICLQKKKTISPKRVCLLEYMHSTEFVRIDFEAVRLSHKNDWMSETLLSVQTKCIMQTQLVSPSVSGKKTIRQKCQIMIGKLFLQNQIFCQFYCLESKDLSYLYAKQGLDVFIAELRAAALDNNVFICKRIVYIWYIYRNHYNKRSGDKRSLTAC